MFSSFSCDRVVYNGALGALPSHVWYIISRSRTLIFLHCSPGEARVENRSDFDLLPNSATVELDTFGEIGLLHVEKNVMFLGTIAFPLLQCSKDSNFPEFAQCRIATHHHPSDQMFLLYVRYKTSRYIVCIQRIYTKYELARRHKRHIKENICWDSNNLEY